MAMNIIDIRLEKAHASLQGKDLYVQFTFPSKTEKTAESSSFRWNGSIPVPPEDGDCQVMVEVFENQSFFSFSQDPVASRKLNLETVEFNEEFSLKLKLLAVTEKKKSAGVYFFSVLLSGLE